MDDKKKEIKEEEVNKIRDELKQIQLEKNIPKRYENLVNFRKLNGSIFPSKRNMENIEQYISNNKLNFLLESSSKSDLFYDLLKLYNIDIKDLKDLEDLKSLDGNNCLFISYETSGIKSNELKDFTINNIIYISPIIPENVEGEYEFEDLSEFWEISSEDYPVKYLDPFRRQMLDQKIYYLKKKTEYGKRSKRGSKRGSKRRSKRGSKRRSKRGSKK